MVTTVGTNTLNPPSFGGDFTPTAPDISQIEEGGGDQQRRPRSRQVNVTDITPEEFIPGHRNEPLFENMTPDMFTLSDSCRIAIELNDKRFVGLTCVRPSDSGTENIEHSCSSLKIKLRQISSKPSDKSEAFILRMIYGDPSHIFTIQLLLEELKKNYIDKFNLKFLVLVCDGKIFDLVIKLLIDHGSKYRWCLPYLGEFHTVSAFIRTIYKLHGGFMLEYLASKIELKGATLTRVVKCQDYRSSLDFLLLILEGVLTVEISLYKEFNQNSGKNQELQDLISRVRWDERTADRKEALEELLRDFNPFWEDFTEFVETLSAKSDMWLMLNNFLFREMSGNKIS